MCGCAATDFKRALFLGTHGRWESWHQCFCRQWKCRTSLLPIRFDFVLAEFIGEVAARQLQLPGGLGLHTLAGLQSPQNQTLLNLLQKRPQVDRRRQRVDPGLNAIAVYGVLIVSPGKEEVVLGRAPAW